MFLQPVPSQRYKTIILRVLFSKVDFFSYFSTPTDSTTSNTFKFPQLIQGRGILVFEAIIWLVFVSLPVNLASFYFASKAPEFHHDVLEQESVNGSLETLKGD